MTNEKCPFPRRQLPLSLGCARSKGFCFCPLFLELEALLGHNSPSVCGRKKRTQLLVTDVTDTEYHRVRGMIRVGDYSLL